MVRSFLAGVAAVLSLVSHAQQSRKAGEFLVLLEADAHAADVVQAFQQRGTAVLPLKAFAPVGRSGRYHKLVVEGDGRRDEELLREVLALPGVRAASFNHRLTFTAQPNDAQYGTQWNLADVGVEAVWDHTTGGTMANGHRIGVALSDLAIQTNHPDLQGNIWPGSPHQGGGEDHGTEVASVMGAVGNNGLGIAGLNWDLEIVSSGTTDDLADAIDQMEFATGLREQFNASNGQNGLLVVSLTASWVFEGVGSCNGLLEPLFSDMADAGILFVTSGPNTATSMEPGTTYPANCALAEHLVVTSYGPDHATPFAFGPNTVHLLAPGLSIPVATVGGGFTVVNGNSYAVPTVAGAIALLYSMPCNSFAQLVLDDPQAARALVKNAILDHTAPFPGGSSLTITGGKLDVHAAYEALMAQCVPSCTDHTITFTTNDDPVTSWTIRDAALSEVAEGGGNTIAVCLDDGCYTINLNGPDGLPMEADFVVENAGGVVFTGNSFGGIVSFSIGEEVPGCTLPGSGNFDPQANCNDGTCCSGHTVELLLAPNDLESEGTVQIEVSSDGATLFQGTLPIQFNSEYGFPVAGWSDCIGSACLQVEVIGSDVSLYEEGFLYVDGDTGDPLSFPVSEGFSGVLGEAVELCDGVDNDCDGEVDEDFIWYVDADNDGWGAFGTGAVHCAPPTSGFAQQEGDCDDTDPARSPDQLDMCEAADGIDNDCDGEVDEDGLQMWYEDLDGDGYGTTGVLACTAPAQHTLEPGDCDDTDANVHPDAEELCDGIDNDCDATVDDGFTWFADADGDGYGDDATAQVSCTPIDGTVSIGGDCNDNDPLLTAVGAPCDDGNAFTHSDHMSASCECEGTPSGQCPEGEVEDCNGNCAPLEWIGDGVCDDGTFEHNGVPIFFNCEAFNFDGGDCDGCVPEICDGEDNDCDGAVDEDFIWYADADGDGWGLVGSAVVLCDVPAEGFTQVEGDCDDSDPAVHAMAVEICDGIDNNCDGVTDGTMQDFQVGCPDPMACNYDPGAVCGEGVCVQGSIADGSETFASDFTATDVNGNTVNLYALLAEGKTVVLDFFTTWCPPSRLMDNAHFLQDWYAHMGPDGLDHIRIVSIEIEDTATATGSLAPFLEDATWPFIAQGGGTIAQQYTALDLYGGVVPTLVMICPDRTAQRIYPSPDRLPCSGIFNYDPLAAFELLNENCGCRGTPCMSGIGCMDANACNYDPAATCPGACTFEQEWFVDNDGDGHGTTSLGMFCAQPPNSAPISGDCNDADPGGQLAFDLYVFTASEEDAGSAHYIITQGDNVIEGDVQLPASSEGIGSVPVCIGTGCFTIAVEPNDVPLYEECYIAPNGDVENAFGFSTIDGFQGALNGVQEEVCDGVDNDCDGEVDEDCEVSVRVKLLLEGPYDQASGMMQDGMRSLGLVPTVEPYSGIGYPHAYFNGGEATEPSVLSVTGTDAIVDWVVLELRSAVDPSLVLVSRCALVQRDGDVVEMDGLSPLIVPGSSAVPYHIAVRHRNHLGAMTANTVLLGSGTVDFTSPALVTYGTDARKLEGGKALLWAGDATFDGVLKYTGAQNDRDPILVRIGGIVPTATATGYHREDVDLDGTVRYTGGGNDRDPILVNIGGVVPTAVRQEQLP